ncbi:MAG: AarF/UbiB family protein [archaeon]
MRFFEIGKTFLYLAFRHEPTQLRESLEKLGSVFIKFGQLLSLRPDLIPEEYCNELFYLLENVPSFDKEEVDKIFLGEFGKTPDQIFTNFKYAPVGSASFSQVHEAYLGKQKVAVKVQRPNIECIVKEDIEIMKFFASIIDFFSFSPNKIMDSVREFEMWTKEELDYLQEAKYTKEFYQRTSTTKVPEVYEKYSSNKIITFEFIEGITISKYLLARRNGDKKLIRRINLDEREVANKLLLSTIKQIYIDGFFHADPHPANIIYGNDKRIYFIDFGISGRLTKEQRLHHLRYTRSAILRDKDTTFDELMKFCETDAITNKEKIRKEHNEIMERMLGSVKNGKRPELGKYLIDTLKLIKKYKLKMPKDRLRYFRAMITLQSVVYEIYPDIELEEVSDKFVSISLVNLIESMPEILKKENLQKSLLSFINAVEKEIAR